MVSAQGRREQVAHARARGLSVRRACALLSVARSALGYGSRMAAKDGPIRIAMARLSAQYPRFGCRRIQVFLERGLSSKCGTHASDLAQVWAAGTAAVSTPSHCGWPATTTAAGNPP